MMASRSARYPSVTAPSSMCCRARRRSSWTSVKKGLSLMRRHYARRSPLRAKARLRGVVRAAAPFELAADAGLPHRAQKDREPERRHQRMAENRVEDRIAQRGEDDDADD